MTTATYDGTGLRASSVATPSGGSAAGQQYVWNTNPAVPQLLMDSASAYIYVTGTAPAEQVNLSTGTITYLVTDSLGSVRGAVSSAGALTGTTSYDAFGNPQAIGGLTSTTPFGFAGGYTDPDGLIYLINRYYNPATGQFISVDPDLAQTQAPYAYAGGNPVTNTDPTGLTLENHHCVERATSGGWHVKVCIRTVATVFHGKWNAEAVFTTRSGNLFLVGAKSIGMDVCGEGRKPTNHCKHNTDVNKNPGSFGPKGDFNLWSGSYLSGIPEGYNWIYAWVDRAFALLTNGQKTKPVSLRDQFVRTCRTNCVA